MSKRIIYIVGCGRSGSTLMGFALGNIAGALDLGEVMDFLRFRGHPNGFDSDSDNYQFWDGVLKLFSQLALKLSSIAPVQGLLQT